MAPQEKYTTYTVIGKTIQELLQDLKQFQDEAEQITQFLDGDYAGEGGSISYRSGDEDRAQIIDNITLINNEINRLRGLETPDQKIEKVEFALGRNNVTRKKLQQQEKILADRDDLSEDDWNIEMAKIMSEYSELISSDEKLKKTKETFERQKLNANLSQEEKQIDKSYWSLDRSNQSELDRVRRLASVKSKLKELQRTSESDDSGSGDDDPRGPHQCRMVAKRGRGRCQRRFGSRQNRDKHETKIHPNKDFWHES